MHVDAQRAAGQAAGDAQQRRRERPAQRAAAASPIGGAETCCGAPVACRVQRPGARPTSEPRAQRLAQLGRVGVGGSDEAARLDAGELEHAPAGVERAHRLRAESSPTNSGDSLAIAAARVRRPAGRRRLQVAEAVLGDRVAACARARAANPQPQVDGQTAGAGRGPGSPAASRGRRRDRRASRGSARRARTSPARCRARATARTRSGGIAGLVRRRRQHPAIAGGEPLERALPGPRLRRCDGQRAPSRRRSAGEPASASSAPASASGAGRPQQAVRRRRRSARAARRRRRRAPGRPLACASSTTWPKVSVSLGKQKASALA